MEYILADALDAFNRHSGWIIWNLFLAFIPLSLSFWLFRWSGKGRSIPWWIGLIVFVAFLPNAPYLLTDIIHLIRATRSGYSAWVLTLIFIPLHLSAILLGWQAYVISVMNHGHYLKTQNLKKLTLWFELGLHALSALGVYLGRFRRFNSWDFVTQPDAILLSTLNDLTSKRPAFVMLVTFIILTVLYWLTKQVNLGLILRFRQVMAERRAEQQAKLGSDG